MTSPESALYPVTFPVVNVALQSKVAGGTLDVKGIWVESPEQMVFERGLLVTVGRGTVKTEMVSETGQ